MTRQLRQRHRRMMLALAIVVPLVFIVGLLARRAVPVVPAITTLGSTGAATPTPR